MLIGNDPTTNIVFFHKYVVKLKNRKKLGKFGSHTVNRVFIEFYSIL